VSEKPGIGVGLAGNSGATREKLNPVVTSGLSKAGNESGQADEIAPNKIAVTEALELVRLRTSDFSDVGI